MKKELLRVHNLTYQSTPIRFVEQISLCIMEGSCVGFLGLADSGKDLLVQLLTGKIEFDLKKYQFYIHNNRVNKIDELQELVYLISADNYQIERWTVAEYICIQSSRWLMLKRNEREMRIKAEQCLEKLEVSIDVSRQLKNLSEYEKRIVDIVKAYNLGAHLLIIEDEMTGMRHEDIEQFRSHLIRIMKKANMAAIINSHSYLLVTTLADQYVLFNNGKIVKKCRKDYIRDRQHLEEFLFEHMLSSKKRSLETYIAEQSRLQGNEKEIIYCVHNVKLKDGKIGNFDFAKGKVTTLLISGSQERKRLFEILSGRLFEYGVRWIIDNEELKNTDFSEFVNRKIVSVMHMGEQREVFAYMSVGENLLLPSLQKITNMDYILHSSNLIQSIASSDREVLPEVNSRMENVEEKDQIAVILERWYIYSPRVLILMEPFSRCDIYGISVVKSYISKFAKRGTSVLVIKSREEYMEDISDDIISIY